MLKYLLVALFAVLQLTVTPMALAVQPPPVKVEINLGEAFDYACSHIQLQGVNCDEIPYPAIDVGNTLPWNLGEYRWDNTVYLSGNMVLRAPAEYSESVLVHEIAHYLWDVAGMSHDDLCGTEALSFTISNEFVSEKGHPEWGQWDWAARYGCYGEQE